MLCLKLSVLGSLWYDIRTSKDATLDGTISDQDSYNVETSQLICSANCLLMGQSAKNLQQKVSFNQN